MAKDSAKQQQVLEVDSSHPESLSLKAANQVAADGSRAAQESILGP